MNVEFLNYQVCLFSDKWFSFLIREREIKEIRKNDFTRDSLTKV